MREPILEGILYKYNDDDFELWQLDIPDEAVREIEVILDKYRHRGCSCRGNAKEIYEELKDM